MPVRDRRPKIAPFTISKTYPQVRISDSGWKKRDKTFEFTVYGPYDAVEEVLQAIEFQSIKGKQISSKRMRSDYEMLGKTSPELFKIVKFLIADKGDAMKFKLFFS